MIKPVSRAAQVAAIGVLLLVIWRLLSSEEGWVRVLDDANLVFHEAGHPIFGVFSSRLEVYGGTLGQLTFPLLCSIHFYRRGEPVALGLCAAWFFENFLNISRYMADARAQILPLVGGGEHDWTDIFSRWHVLEHNLAIAHGVSFLGWVGLFFCGVWLVSFQKVLGDA